ncbi:hypothetical protein ACFLYW_02505, partial [Thermodesulfobacteriota bacterium]
MAVAVYITFSSVLSHSFLSWDDPIYVTENPLIQDFSWQNIKKIFSTFVSGNYHPIPLLSHNIEYYFIKADPYYYHLNNLALHIINSLLVFFLVLKLSNNIFSAVITTLLFGIHPLRVESVAWIADRKDLLYGFFIICSMISYLNYLSHNKIKYYNLTIAFFVFSLLSKAMALAYPFILLLFDIYSGRRINIRLFKDKIPFFIIALLFGVIALYARGSYTDMLQESNFTLVETLSLGTYRLIYYYLLRIFFPVGISLLYPYPNVEYPSIYLVCSSGILVVALLLAIRFSLHKTKKIAFGLCFFFLFICPVLFVA